jgi:hypothetical protein
VGHTRWHIVGADRAHLLRRARSLPRAGLRGAAGWASIGAGTIHAAAAAAHSDAVPAMAGFALIAVCQVGWGALALGHAGRRLMAAGALGNLVALAAWLTAKLGAISVVGGLELAERVQPADSLAAVLAALAVACAVGARRGAADRALGPALARVLATTIAAAAVAGVAATPNHAHGEPAAAASAHHDALERADALSTKRSPGRSRSSDVDGVTVAQRARASKLVAVTRRRLPRFADVAAAQADGYVSIGDAVSGYEHYVKWAYVNDDRVLDPDRAESLVYRVSGERRRLVSAMYMLGEGKTLDTVPDVGGRLTQWHIHDDLCFTDDADSPVVAGITTPGRRCPAPLVKRGRVPMLHVWIVEHRCGPFAALEGVAAGQVRDGERPRCDRGHDPHR